MFSLCSMAAADRMALGVPRRFTFTGAPRYRKAFCRGSTMIGESPTPPLANALPLPLPLPLPFLGLCHCSAWLPPLQARGSALSTPCRFPSVLVQKEKFNNVQMSDAFTTMVPPPMAGCFLTPAMAAFQLGALGAQALPQHDQRL